MEEAESKELDRWRDWPAVEGEEVRRGLNPDPGDSVTETHRAVRPR